jgi:hypothetical protein
VAGSTGAPTIHRQLSRASFNAKSTMPDAIMPRHSISSYVITTAPRPCVGLLHGGVWLSSIDPCFEMYA